VKSDGSELAEFAMTPRDTSFSSLAEIASCSYEAREVTCYVVKESHD